MLTQHSQLKYPQVLQQTDTILTPRSTDINQLETTGAYLIDGSGNYIHYIRIQENPTYYARQIDFLPAGWSRPAIGLYSSTGTGLPTISYTHKLRFNPIQQDLSNYFIRCNLITKNYSNPPDIIGTFTNQGTTIEQYIEVKPNEYTWLEIPHSVRSYIEIIIMDQNQQFVKFQEAQINIQLLVRTKNKLDA
ncbi:hypothetical protein THRCLA_21169 [Thraustotheca clavata]|uniref:Uncharacterized protein n=1 Tax=Thraustotheca clavata TaxID=74557 RepID=A0A1V9ZZH6_9STRA|nr:hypothetical protein THRCLA_21169 [Thraustotheca clavata]